MAMAKYEWAGRNNKAIALLRVSSLGQDGNTSHETQERDCARYCQGNGLNLIAVVPIVESARDSDLRKKYKELLVQAQKQNIQHILFHKFDREARNLTDNESNEKLVRAGTIVLHYVAENKVLHQNSPDSDFLMRDFYAVQNKHYSRDLSSKVRRGTRQKAERGEWPGCRPPDGYVQEKLRGERGFEKRRGARIVPDPNTLTVKRVQREFEIRAEIPTPSLRNIRKRIIAEGLLPPEQVKKYGTSTIERRLKNIFYDGRFEWQGVEYRANHERIIPSELFWCVQETFGIKTPHRRNPEALFGGGWLKCGVTACGCDITYDPKTKIIKSTGETRTYKYYRCSNGKRVHASLKGMTASEDSIMDQFGGAVRHITIRDDFRDELLKAVNETLAKMKRAIRDDLERFEAALIASKKREDRAYDRYDAGEIDKEMYNRQRKRLQAEQLEYTRLMKQAQLGISDAAGETVESLIELANKAESLWKHMTREERRTLLDKILSNRVLDGATVRYEIIKPLRLLGEMKEDKEWRPRMVNN